MDPADKIRTVSNKKFKAVMTVEAAGVFSLVLFTVLILLSAAFTIRAEAEGKLSTHEEVEYERHLIANKGEKEITRQKSGQGWSIKVTLPVFRPENSLRQWSLLEEILE